MTLARQPVWVTVALAWSEGIGWRAPRLSTFRFEVALTPKGFPEVTAYLVDGVEPVDALPYDPTVGVGRSHKSSGLIDCLKSALEAELGKPIEGLNSTKFDWRAA